MKHLDTANSHFWGMFSPGSGKPRTGPADNMNIVTPPFKPIQPVDFNPDFSLPLQSSIFPIKTFSKLNSTLPNDISVEPNSSIFMEDINTECPLIKSRLDYYFNKYNDNSTSLVQDLSKNLINRGYLPQKP
jgi:hypothetical protein